MNKKYNLRSLINKIILGVSITLLILVLIVFFTSDIDEVVKAFANISIPNLLIAIALTLLYFLLTPITVCILTKSTKNNISLKHTYLIGNSEHFFNGITPFATGGQPFQVYSYARLGVKPSESTGILMMNFIIHMVVTNIFALLSLAVYPKLIHAVGNLLPMVIIGFTMNFLTLILIISLALSKRLVKFLEKILIKLASIKWLSKLITPAIPAFNKYCADVQLGFKELWQHKTAAVVCFIIRGITMFVNYAITFYILRTFKIDVGYEDLFFVICGTAFAITTCVFIPTPGGSGGIEFAFSSIFTFVASGLNPNVATSGMLLWRLLTYYILMLISFFDYLWLEKSTKKYEKENRLDALEPPEFVQETTTNLDNNIWVFHSYHFNK